MTCCLAAGICSRRARSKATLASSLWWSTNIRQRAVKEREAHKGHFLQEKYCCNGNKVKELLVGLAGCRPKKSTSCNGFPALRVPRTCCARFNGTQELLISLFNKLNKFSQHTSWTSNFAASAMQPQKCRKMKKIVTKTLPHSIKKNKKILELSLICMRLVCDTHRGFLPPISRACSGLRERGGRLDHNFNAWSSCPEAMMWGLIQG
jgi:hypothetical protein